MESKEEILKRIYLFSRFTPEELKTIADKINHIQLHKGEFLFNEGQEATSLYVVQYGTLQIFAHTGTGDDIGVTNIATGDHFGELPFLDGEKRAGTVEALEPTELWEITYENLRKAFEKMPDMELKFYKEVSHYLVKRMRLLTHDLAYAREIRKRLA